MPKLAKIGYFIGRFWGPKQSNLGRFWGPKQSNLSKHVLNLCKWIIAAVDQAFFGCWQIKIQSKFKKKIWKTSFWASKVVPNLQSKRSKCGMRGKCVAICCSCRKTVSSILCPIIPSNQPKNAKIGQNRLFLRDFGLQNYQIWICVNEL